MAFVEVAAGAAIPAPVAMRQARHRWTHRLFEGIRGELRALEIQQQERAFLATPHGMNFTAAGRY